MTPATTTVLQSHFSFGVLLTLLVVFGASLLTFTLLVRRNTIRRRWVSLSEWAAERRMRIAHRKLTDLPGPIDVLEKLGASPRVRLRIERGLATRIVQFET